MHHLKKLLFLTTLTALSLNNTFCHASPEAISKQVSSDFTSVAKKAIPAVVWIKVKSANSGKESSYLHDYERNQNPFDFFNDDFLQKFFGLPNEAYQQPIVGQASGFIVSPDGYILTNSHVVNEMSEITVVLNDEREFPGKVIGQDKNTDIALIKIDAKNLPFLKLGDSDKIEVGQWAIAIGNPFGLQASLTVGVISAKGRNNLSLAPVENFIQTDAAINRGNSGGPLLNLDGEVIGINTAIVSGSGGYVGVGFAIPSNIAKYDMDQILDHGNVTRGYIGVALQQISPELAQAFGLEKPEGIIITEVIKDSPAEKAGIKQGDIILKYNHQPSSNVGALRSTVALTKPGTKVHLTILRDKAIHEIPLEIANFPAAEVETAHSKPAKENPLGIEVQPVTSEIARSLGYSEGKGVVVNKVSAGSVAAWAGLEKGSLILAINRQEINSVEQFYQAIQKTPKDKPILLLIKQRDRLQYISIKVES